MAIKPVDIPSAAGLEYGKGDVRHFSQGDDQSVPGLSNPTRHLADRDNRLAEKLNEVIGVVNNQEQFVPLVIPRTVIPPNDQVIVANQRITSGFEARVLSAAVAATPVSTDVELNVYYGEGFGGTTGTSIVSTSTEFTGGVQFYQTGEFIVVLVNKGSQSLEVSGSVMLTVRPLGAEGTLLVGSVIQGPKGDPGIQGPQGIQGPPGTGGAGTPGLVWRSTWSAVTAYNPNDAVSRTSGGVTSSYVALVGNTNVDPVGNPATWDLLAEGVTGPTGPSGAAGSAPTYSSVVVNGTIYTGSDYGPGVYNSTYNAGAVSTPSTAYTLAFRETAVVASGGGDGMAILSAGLRTCFEGSGTVHFPQKVFNGAKCDYNADEVTLTATSNGTTLYGNGTVALVEVEKHPANTGFIVRVNALEPVPIAITVLGAQRIV